MHRFAALVGGSAVIVTLLVAAASSSTDGGEDRNVSANPARSSVEVAAALDGPVAAAGYETAVDPNTGQLRVAVQPGMAAVARPLLAGFGEAVVLEELPYEIGRG